MERPLTAEIPEVQISEKQIPEPQISEIQFESTTYRAAVCPRCGAKFYPLELLDAHMDRHQLRDLFLEGELRKLQSAMGKMR